MSTHAIRLRGFWAVEGGRQSRRFGRPRTLSEGETVWLVGERSPGAGRVLVNEHVVGLIEPGQPFAFEVTSLLQPRNVVAIEVPAGGGLLDEVVVEVRLGERGA